MPRVIQPLNQDDSAKSKPLTPLSDLTSTPEMEKELADAPIKARGIIEASADLYKNIDPTFGEGGIIQSMTVKPVGTHSIDLESQISSAVSLDQQDVSNIIMDDMTQKVPTGGSEFIAGQELMGGAGFVAPDAEHKAAPAQAPQPIAEQKPNIIVG